MNWLAIQVARLTRKNALPLSEMRHLWRRPHRIDGRLSAKMALEFMPTPAEEALLQTIKPLL